MRAVIGAAPHTPQPPAAASEPVLDIGLLTLSRG